ncbi:MULTISPECIES: DUF2065 domain-containing protein [Bosea]|jgi:uncharacterized protein YjeT (DUF2065 family)|uniref:DUF2065 domain-containing protein n=1 Tax=Bosea TaxID=85413 RepID=UPI00214FDC4E|nr:MULTISPECIES: DUF2065 domain-containing protein [Bosea]MCR4523405.1 DUF2065 domain-containing protein [Bosea sp. 47.2.35]MDR6828523.1 uncharacterized protein YjeT (DUF2065 family) [Bosea robiniae]MDR6895182.1 uncharacterized protein YjeT (DUF2065 family) [Bosea sp. BE109]MDR7138578.1 uncharacterized protein YjeT (DUF2065 family) [Bosea sp. BE168]MDR7175447.1 uncharacterized protein YjeT (DUF2065 family) [Bosea sp. BE271]
MLDFIAALGLVFAIEGILFAAIPNLAKDALRSAAETPVDRMRLIGIGSAVLGVILVWLARGVW